MLMKNNNKKTEQVDIITTTTTEILTTEQKMTETVAMLELAQDVCVVGDQQGFVKAAKTATLSFKLVGTYLRASSNLAKAQFKVEEQVLKVQRFKKQYEDGLQEERRLVDECERFRKVACDAKSKAATAFEDTATAWRVEGW